MSAFVAGDLGVVLRAEVLEACEADGLSPWAGIVGGGGGPDVVLGPVGRGGPEGLLIRCHVG